MGCCISGGRRVLRQTKWYVSLKTAAGRKERGRYLVEGARAIGQIASVDPKAIEEILTTDKNLVPADAGSSAIHLISSKQSVRISSTKSPQGIIAVAHIPNDYYSDGLPSSAGNKILCLDDVQDPGNVGTLIRTAAAFGFEGVILSAKSADAFSPKVVQAAAGVYGALWLRRPHSEMVDTLSRLRKSGYAVVSACAQGHPFFRTLGKRPFLLVLGNEGNGISEQIRDSSDYLLSIPIKPVAAESLNVGVAGGICMYLLSGNAFCD